jgi:hypothetical protein
MRGGKTSLYTVEVKDENGLLIAVASVRGYTVGDNKEIEN